MKAPKSLELMMLLSDLAIEGGNLTAKAIAKACFANHGGKASAYRVFLERLEKSGVVRLEKGDSTDPAEWIPQLTQSSPALPHRESPLEAWESEWDGLWTLLAFDLPTNDAKSRFRLREWLKEGKFGKLQGSVWISHRSLSSLENSFEQLELEPNHVACMEGRFWNASETDTFVEKAWKLDQIQDSYADYLRFLDAHPPLDSTPAEFRNWRQRETSLWLAATQKDPMLPKILWPKKREGKNRALEAANRRDQAKKSWLQTASQLS